ncbi:MAG TPA: hypothetical protein VHT73_00430 [Thermodesulfobacteriota bacterium]|nr:hypothetical protein [Thermodesulfobacteriota bacterium]
MIIFCTNCGRYEEEEPLWDKVIFETICEECKRESEGKDGEIGMSQKNGD